MTKEDLVKLARVEREAYNQYIWMCNTNISGLSAEEKLNVDVQHKIAHDAWMHHDAVYKRAFAEYMKKGDQ